MPDGRVGHPELAASEARRKQYNRCSCHVQLHRVLITRSRYGAGETRIGSVRLGWEPTASLLSR